MTARHFDITTTKQWHKLGEQAKEIGQRRIEDFLHDDASRAERYSVSEGGLYLDYAKNLIDDKVFSTFFELLDQSPLAAYRSAMFSGEIINSSEQRPVLHAALRSSPSRLAADGLSHLSSAIEAQKARVKELSDRIRNGQWLGTTGKPVTDLVNLGIGGSDLGPRLVCDALKEFAHDGVRCHFVSNVDGEVIASTLKSLNPETTLVVISSKTFTTQETLLNARSAARWFTERLGLDNPFNSPHFIGVTASPDNALKLGLPADNLLEFWDWVGGRYSLWSTIGFSISVSAGYENFEKLLAGASLMDDHFRTRPWQQNMPVILAVLGIWYTNFLGAESQAVIPYCERLLHFPFYLQQLDMESNGKAVTQDNLAVACHTGPIIWGLTGTNGQHSFFQLLHQGTHLIPVDFIGTIEDRMSSPEHHRVLMANMLAQSAALMQGKQDPELPPYRQYSGNRPSNVMLLDSLSPEILGALIALYEHKVFVQGCLWNINSFDQWGVELGKVLANQLLAKDCDKALMDSSTRNLMAKLSL